MASCFLFHNHFYLIFKMYVHIYLKSKSVQNKRQINNVSDMNETTFCECFKYFLTIRVREIGECLDDKKVRKQPWLKLAKNLLHDVVDVFVTHSDQDVTCCLLPIRNDLLKVLP